MNLWMKEKITKIIEFFYPPMIVSIKTREKYSDYSIIPPYAIKFNEKTSKYRRSI